jgi:SAM-dependent methyltransferase
MLNPLAAETRLAMVLRREAELHEAGWPLALGAGIDELERSVPRQPSWERARGALAFWRRWLDARDHGWPSGDGGQHGVDERSWPALARALADALEGGSIPDDARLRALLRPLEARAGFADHFSVVAADYASFRPRYPDALFAALAAVAPDRGRAWDCATGNGQAALGLAEHFDSVVATDASAAQVSRATAHPRVRYLVAPAEASGLAAGSIALVTVAQALHWLDLDRFYAEARRVLAPGGVIAAWSYGRHRIDGGPIDALVDRFHDEVVAAFWPPERRHVESGYRTVPFPFAELPVAAPPMTADWTLAQLLGYLGTWSSVDAWRREHGEDPVPPLGALLAPLWGDPAMRRAVTWPLALRVGRVGGAGGAAVSP